MEPRLIANKAVNAIKAYFGPGSRVSKLAREETALQGLFQRRSELDHLMRQNLQERNMDFDYGAYARRRMRLNKAIDRLSRRVEPRMASPVRRAGEYAWAYVAEKPLRAAAIYGTAAVGYRILSGGSLTRNADGERDIVGIPI